MSQLPYNYRFDLQPNGERFVVWADELLAAFVELERAVR
jgi:hypothetical protein